MGDARYHGQVLHEEGEEVVGRPEDRGKDDVVPARHNTDEVHLWEFRQSVGDIPDAAHFHIEANPYPHSVTELEWVCDRHELKDSVAN